MYRKKVGSIDRSISILLIQLQATSYTLHWNSHKTELQMKFFRIWSKLTSSLHSGMLATWCPITTNDLLNLLDLINFTLEAPGARPHKQGPYNVVYKVERCLGLHPLPVLTKYNLKITVEIFFTQCSKRSKHIFTGGTGVDWMIKTIILVEWQSYAIVVFGRFALGEGGRFITLGKASQKGHIDLPLNKILLNLISQIWLIR